MKNAMQEFFNTYFKNTEKNNNWVVWVPNAKQRCDMLETIMQWEVTHTFSKND
ncbi:MAG: glucose uptake inhibitor SgrT [Rouxiella aceris]|jgi:DNA-binding transcriptional regulator WhiA|uniref:Glucose uptake inhibitor SgrT n=1 Tax=Rouxiella aceris TaxID=2703884 RepID=A0A848MEU7_9GAMM|nr:glucose uptake inhibitor SgrT [Rouxiella aceris]MDR3430700.1 glucose uptake inhibitor SgrT [Rouxiella aceris]NMP25926.1 glucose uptake inhibitor SgrT [Rouxiella aceris]